MSRTRVKYQNSVSPLLQSTSIIPIHCPSLLSPLLSLYHIQPLTATRGLIIMGGFSVSPLYLLYYSFVTVALVHIIRSRSFQTTNHRCFPTSPPMLKPSWILPSFPPRFLSLLPFTLCISFRYNSFCEILTRPADVYRPDDSYRPYQVSCSVSFGVFLWIFPHYAHPRLLRKRECVVSAGAETASAIGSDLPIHEIPRARPSRIAIWVLDSKRIAPCRQQCAPVALSSNPGRSSVEIS